LYGAHLEGADLSGTHLEWANLSGTHLEGADLGGTHLEGADLGGAYLDGEISFAPAILRGAGARDINLEHIQCETFTEAFGDASVTLPDGYAAGEGKLSHWSPEKLDWENFYEAWRKWQAEQHPDLLPPYYTAED
ncbi:pentapeptide repeat-containing protein, partial [Maribius pontilimi]